jgi:hypothetical protein
VVDYDGFSTLESQQQDFDVKYDLGAPMRGNPTQQQAF